MMKFSGRQSQATLIPTLIYNLEIHELYHFYFI